MTFIKQLDILSVNQTFDLNGGSDRCFFNMNELLRSKGHKVCEFAASGKFAPKSEHKDVYPTQNSFSFKNPMNLAKYIYNKSAKSSLESFINEKNHFDIAHLQIYYGHLTTSILSPLLERAIPIVQTLHEYKLSCPVYTHVNDNAPCIKCIEGSTVNCLINRCKDGSTLKSTVRFLEFHISRMLGDVNKIDRFICVSNFQKKLMENAGVPKEKLEVIYNFTFPVGDYSSENAGYLLYFGRIDKVKGLETLVNAAAITPKIKYVIAGTGPELSHIVNLAGKLGCSNIDFVGFKQGDELSSLIKGCKAVIVPSEWFENCSMTVLESKAYGKPVIGSSIGGITEQIQDNINGFLFTPKNHLELTHCIERIACLPKVKYEEMCASSLEDFELRYSPNIHYEKLNGLYKSIIRW